MTEATLRYELRASGVHLIAWKRLRRFGLRRTLRRGTRLAAARRRLDRWGWSGSSAALCEQRVGARPGPTTMSTRLEGDVRGRARGSGTGDGECLDLGMRVTRTPVPTLADDPAGRVDQDAADSWVGSLGEAGLGSERERPTHQLDISRAADRISCPWLVLHGRNDETVPFAEADSLAASAARPELVAIDHTGHTFGAVHPFAGFTPALARVFDASVAHLSRYLT